MKKNKIMVFWILSLFFGTMVIVNLNTFDIVEASGFKFGTILSYSHASFLGENGSDRSGYSVAIAGDVNGDGYDDILIGAYQNEEVGNWSGQTYLIFGRGSNWSMDIDLSDADASFLGEDSKDRAGYSVAGAGDINGDGYDDILIGAPYDEGGIVEAGQTYVIFGKKNGWSMDTSLANADASFLGEDGGDRSGYIVAGAGDVNGDGFDDILIGAPYNNENGTDAGQTYLIFGNDSIWSMDTSLSNSNASFFGEYSGDYSGISVAGTGDVNGDGYDDILIGAFRNSEDQVDAGQTYLIFGNPTSWSMDTSLGNADASFWGEGKYDFSGRAVAGAGDVNGDGFDDILIGAYRNSAGGGQYAGQAYLIFGKLYGWIMDFNLTNANASFIADNPGDHVGRSLSGAGDVNSDGFDDILIGAYVDKGPGSNLDAGQTYLFLGNASGWMNDDSVTNADASFKGEGRWDNSGISMSCSGDVNDDGYDDILIGAFKDEQGGGSFAGQTYLIFFESKPSSPKSIIANLSTDGSSIKLTWDVPTYWKPLSKFIIYKSMDGTHYKELKQTSIIHREYVDLNVEMGRNYYYAVVTVDGSGEKSDMSSVVSITCDKDTDMDGIGNAFDDDDDGDGIVDHQDVFPTDSTEWLDSDLDGLGNVIDTDDDNDGIPDISDIYPLNPLNDLSSIIGNMNITLMGMNYNLVDMQNDINNMEVTLTNLINGLSTDIDSLSMKINTLSNDLNSLNSSLHSEINALETELSTFESETKSSFQDIINRLKNLDVDLSAEIEILNNTINNLDSTTLNEIKQQLTEVRNAISKLNTSGGGVSSSDISKVLVKLSELEVTVDDIYTVLNLRLNNISTQLKELDKIETIASNIETIEELLKEVQADQENLDKKQGETTDSVGASSSGVWVAVVLLIIVVLLLLMMLVRGGKGKGREEVSVPREEPEVKMRTKSATRAKKKGKKVD